MLPVKIRKKHITQEISTLLEDINHPPIPVLEIAEQNGVDVVFADFGKHADNVSGLCDFESAKIYVNKDDTTVRQSFTIAHELGHWIMHREAFEHDPEAYGVLPRFSSPDRSNVLEQEANYFAAEFLVPKKLLNPVRDFPVAKLADIFDVSRTMMEFRLKNV